MSLTVFLSGHLKTFSNGKLEVPVDRDLATVGEALDSLWAAHPAHHDRVLNEQGEIRQHVNIFVGSDVVRRKKRLETKVDSSEIYIFNAVSGG